MAFFKKNKFKIAAVTLFSICMSALFRVYSIMDIWTGADMDSYGISKMAKLIFGNWQIYVMFVGILLVSSVFALNRSIRNFIYKYRFALAGGIFVLCVVFEISGSSVGRWCDTFNSEDKDVLLGISRDIRSDEYCISTPYFFSQILSDSPDAFSYFSQHANGYESDLFLGIRQPIKHVLTIFRPFTLGYLFLSPAKGLSFWWCGKLIVLFLATFEMGMMLSDRNKKLSGIMALMITFSPVVQWWFSTSISEVIIYTELAMLLFNRYLKEKKAALRIALLVGILYLAGCFIMVLYPSWQVPFVYIILVLTVWLIIRNRRNIALKWYDYVSVAAGLIGIALVFMYIFNKSADTLELISNTVYPGGRLETGGSKLSYMFTYPLNAWFGITSFGFGPNICDSATIIDFFPLSIILPVAAMIKNKKKDSLSIMLLGLNLFFFVWIAIGFPEIIAKITFMSNSQPIRTTLAFGFVNVLLLVRGVYLIREPFKNKTAVIISALAAGIVTAASYVFTKSAYLQVTGMKIFAMLLILAFILVFIAMFSLMQFKKKHGTLVSFMIILVISFLGGVMVNPVRKGVDSVYSVPWVEEISKVSDSEGGNSIWAVECSDLESPVFANVGLLCGVKTFNATAIYPNMELWEQLDPDGEYTDVYNRYAHISVYIKESGEPEFELLALDSFKLYITFEDLQKVGVKYVTGIRDLSEYADKSSCNITRINSREGIYIYRIE